MALEQLGSRPSAGTVVRARGNEVVVAGPTKPQVPAARREPPHPQRVRISSQSREKLGHDLDRLLDRWVGRLERRGQTIDDVGGVEAVVHAMEAALPVVNELARRAGPVHTTNQLRRLLPGVHAHPLGDQAVYNRVKARTLIGAKTMEGQWVYPAFQFQPRPGRLQPRDDVLTLWRLLPAVDQDRFDAWSLIAWLTGARRDLDGQAPLAWLDTHGIDDRLQRAAGQVRRRAAAS